MTIGQTLTGFYHQTVGIVNPPAQKKNGNVVVTVKQWAHELVQRYFQTQQPLPQANLKILGVPLQLQTIEDLARLTCTIMRLARNVTRASSYFFNDATFVNKVVSCTRLVSTAVVPFTLYPIYESLVDLKNSNNMQERFDTLPQLYGRSSRVISLYTDTIIKFNKNMGGILFVMGLASMISFYRGWSGSFYALKEMQKCLGASYSQDHSKWNSDLIENMLTQLQQNSRLLFKHDFRLHDPQNALAKIQTVQKNARSNRLIRLFSSVTKIETSNFVKGRQLANSFKRLTEQRFILQTLLITSQAINLVGITILYLPALCTIGYGLMAGSAFLSLLRFFYQQNAIAEFEKKLAML